MKLQGWTTICDLATGEVLYDHKNVITNFGKTRAAELLGGLSTDFIDRMAIGNGGASSGSPSTPFIPLATDTGLAAEVDRTTSVNPTVVGFNQLKFTAIFLTAPPLPFVPPTFKVINEVGLFCADDVQPGTPRMFARNTFPSIPFDTSDREGCILTWTISIV